MTAGKYSRDDMIMGYQKSVKYTGLFAGKILRVRPSLTLFGSANYEIELLRELQKNNLMKIWVGEDFSIPFDREKYDEALYHWLKFEELLDNSRQELEIIKNILSS